MIKGTYEKDSDYLAAITENGIWIKEKNFGKNYIIRSKNLDEQNLMDLSIYEFDLNNNFLKAFCLTQFDLCLNKHSLK